MAAPFSPDVLTVRDTEIVWYEQCVTRYGAVLDLQCRRTDVVHHFKSTGIHYLSPNWLLRWLRRSRQTCSHAGGRMWCTTSSPLGYITSRLTGCYDGSAVLARRAHNVLTVRDTETVWYEQCVTRYGAVLDLQCRRTDVVHHFKSTGIHYLSPNWLLRWLCRSRQTCSHAGGRMWCTTSSPLGYITSRLTGCYDGCAVLARRAHNVLTVRDTETVWYEQYVTRYGAVLDLQCRRTDVVHHFRSTGIHYLSPNWLLRWLRLSRQTCSQLAVQEDGCGTTSSPLGYITSRLTGCYDGSAVLARRAHSKRHRDSLV
ncbi:hypothetical protein J6590_035881 [Homalodisca vitripennis]|nr:hypothetical protein J6590_035881 [Homalodisca vitripennis]